MSNTISIKGLPKGAVLAALYNASKPQGMGFMQYDPKPMTPEEGQKVLDATPGQYFDYLKGRVMKIGLSKDEVGTWGYDRDNGPGAAVKALEALKKTGDANNSFIDQTHRANTQASAVATSERLDDRTSVKSHGPGVVEFRVGLDDVKEHLEPKVRAITGSRNG